MRINLPAEIGAGVSVLAAVMQWVPPIVAILGAIWWTMKIIIEWPVVKIIILSWFRKKLEDKKKEP